MEVQGNRESKYARSLIEASLDPLVTISVNGQITDMNEALASVTGLSRQDLTGTDFFDYFTEPGDARGVYREIFASGSVADAPLTIRHKDGKLTKVLFNGSVYRDDMGNVSGVVVVARDVTAQVLIASELNEAKKVADLARETALDLAKVDSGKMVFENVPFKMAYSISAMLHLFESRIREKNLAFVKEYDERIPKVLLGDPLRLHQVILNLVSNADKFTYSGKITVSVRMVSEDSEKVIVEFSVADTGIGIGEDKIDKIFENFQQTGSTTTRLYGGTGLGLAIVKQLVEPQGGTIKVTCRVNEGSVFSFTLGFLNTVEKPESDTELTNLKKTGKMNIKVLVVEDMALNQLLMKTVLEDFGFKTDIAAKGKIAIEKMKSRSYDIILMDLLMPEMNGFEATEYIRHTMNSKIPIIALTADVTTTDLEKCRAVGMNDYVPKPIDEKKLYNKIVALVLSNKAVTGNKNVGTEMTKCTDLTYLSQRTKSKPALMMEMISVFLEQTPPLVSEMSRSLREKDWKSLYSAVHKIIPSFSIMGINPMYENLARKIQEYTRTEQNTEELPEMILQLEKISYQACKELQAEYDIIKMTADER